MTQKKKLQIIVSLVLFGILAAIVLLTVYLMSLVGTRPIAPTAPESRPRAANTCTFSFSVPPSECNGPCDDTSDCSTGLVCEPNSNACRDPKNPSSETCESPVYSCNSGCTSTAECSAVNPNYVCTDIDGVDRCRLNSALSSATCEQAFACDSECETDAQCQTASDEYICEQTVDGGRCRLEDNPLSETCAPVSYACDSPCTTDAQCQSVNPSYVCHDQSQTCRLESYPQSSSCQPIGGPQPSPTPPAPTPTPPAATPTPVPTPTPGASPQPTPTPTPTTSIGSHLVCQNEACVSIPGNGTSECSTDADCAEVTSLPVSGNLELTVMALAVGAMTMLGGIFLLKRGM